MKTCPRCDSEMKQETAISDGWNYKNDQHTTNEAYFWVCENKDCNYEYEETGYTEPEDDD